MKRRVYWKDIWQSFSQSKGRALSIMSLMALGSFTLVGLKVSGPDMAQTGVQFFREHQTADLYVLSNYGLDQSDQVVLDKEASDAQVEYGYFQDVVLKGTTQAIRLFSESDSLSTYELVSGRLPKASDELALSAAYEKDYHIGQTLTVSEKTVSGQSLLKTHTFKITGFVNSSEILSRVNLGPTSAGTGELAGYGVLPKDSFTSPVYTLARLRYQELEALSPYSETYKKQLASQKEDLEEALAQQAQVRFAQLKNEKTAQLEEGERQVSQAQADLNSAKTQLNEAQETLAQKEALLSQARALYGEAVLSDETAELTQAKDKLTAEKTRIEQGEQRLAEKASQLKTSASQLDKLAPLTYQVYTRREVPGSEGYLSYENNMTIITSLANVFPVVLYFVAALVTFTTMTRFVDEERLKLGTLKALGYSDYAIRRKFLLYGLVTGTLGTVIGSALGQVLLPTIIYRTYADKIILAPITLGVSPSYLLLALGLGLLSSVFPAFWVSKKALEEKPAQLLLPKPPAAGSRILLERLPFIWRRLRFTQKVTARNLFRYKQRMLMTIFGVAGSVALLFAGIGVRGSIANLNARQFQDIITYDMIVAENASASEAEKSRLQKELHQAPVASSLSIRYDVVTKETGKHGDQQDITVLSFAKGADLTPYLHLMARQTKEPLSLTDKGAVISEKLAQLTKTKVGDKLSVTDESGRTLEVTVTGITEMYMGHFILMTESYHASVFKGDKKPNAYLLKLAHTSEKATQEEAAHLMALSAVAAVVQNTTLKEQVKTIVSSLGRVMYVFILTSALLASVILYNLTTVNVAERLRELSTIKVLGFYDKEVTRYIYREILLLSSFGVVFGFGLGYALHRYMLRIIPPDPVLFNPHVTPAAFLLPVLLITGLLALLGLFVHHWLRRVDMLEALKSVE